MNLTFKSAGTTFAAIILAGCASSLPPKAAVAVTQAPDWVAPARATSAMETDGVWVNKRSIEVREAVLPPVFEKILAVKLDVAMTVSQMVYAISRETGIRVSLAPETRGDAAKPITMAGHKFNAPLREVLDQITSMANMAWRYREGAIEIYRTDTRVFDIAAVPGISEFSHGGEGVSGQSSKTGAALDLWTSVERDIKGLVSPAGKVSVSQANRTITVTDSLDGVAAAQAYVRELNNKRSRQVAVAVTVYAVDSIQKQGGLNWDSVNKNMQRAGVERPQMVASAESSFGAILPASHDNDEAAKKAFVSALQAVGMTTVITEASRLVLNGEMLPLTSARESGAGREGVSMTMAPNIFGAHTVNMTAAFDFAYADVQRSTRSLVEKFSVKSGQTYVFGFKQSDGASEMAGGTAPEASRTIIVAITPTIVNAVR